MSNRKSFKLPKNIEVEMSQKVIQEGYGMRGKSRWINYAINNFLSLADEEFIFDCLDNAEYITGLDTTVTCRTSDTIENLVNVWVKKARINNPMREGVRSNIYRASVIQGLLGSVQTIKILMRNTTQIKKATR